MGLEIFGVPLWVLLVPIGLTLLARWVWPDWSSQKIANRVGLYLALWVLAWTAWTTYLLFFGPTCRDRYPNAPCDMPLEFLGPPIGLALTVVTLLYSIIASRITLALTKR